VELELVELHSEKCKCGGGCWTVRSGESPSPKCLRKGGRMPESSLLLPIEQWQATGRPSTTEEYQAALRQVRDRRQQPRLRVALQVRLNRIDGEGESFEQEITTTKDVSEGGMLVATTLPLGTGETILIDEEGGPFRGRAEVLETIPGEAGDPPCARLKLLDEDAADYIRRLLYTLSS
jgi:hypothetical protein